MDPPEHEYNESDLVGASDIYGNGGGAHEEDPAVQEKELRLAVRDELVDHVMGKTSNPPQPPNEVPLPFAPKRKFPSTKPPSPRCLVRPAHPIYQSMMTQLHEQLGVPPQIVLFNVMQTVATFTLPTHVTIPSKSFADLFFTNQFDRLDLFKNQPSKLVEPFSFNAKNQYPAALAILSVENVGKSKHPFLVQKQIKTMGITRIETDKEQNFGSCSTKFQTSKIDGFIHYSSHAPHMDYHSSPLVVWTNRPPLDFGKEKHVSYWTVNTEPWILLDGTMTPQFKLDTMNFYASSTGERYRDIRDRSGSTPLGNEIKDVVVDASTRFLVYASSLPSLVDVVRNLVTHALKTMQPLESLVAKDNVPYHYEPNTAKRTITANELELLNKYVVIRYPAGAPVGMDGITADKIQPPTDLTHIFERFIERKAKDVQRSGSEYICDFYHIWNLLVKLVDDSYQRERDRYSRDMNAHSLRVVPYVSDGMPAVNHADFAVRLSLALFVAPLDGCGDSAAPLPSNPTYGELLKATAAFS
jgi:hypothetical protein